jgi:fructuronate reductase
VQREAFVQWVIENRFSSQMPDWESVGATVTDDVPAYDRAKLRLLNGAHSTLAYVGLLTGHQTVAQAIGDPQLSAFVRAMMVEDIIPTLKAPRGLDLMAYVESILKRFHNSTIRHALSQIAWDGSQKLPFRILGTIRDNLGAQRSIDRLCVPIAAWMHFVRRQATRGERVTDPLADRLFEIGGGCQSKALTDLPRFFSLGTVFTSDLTGSARFVSALSRAYDRLASTPASIADWLR